MKATDLADISDTARDLDLRLEEFAAELTGAVYPLVLPRRPKDSWLELELALWKALMKTVERWSRLRPAASSADDREACRERLLADLTESALYIALKTGTTGPLLDLQLALYRTVRLVTRRYAIRVRYA
jgi:hypothetical protein